MTRDYEDYNITIEGHEFIARVEVEYDDNPDISWLGEYSDSIPQHSGVLFVDRKTGRMYRNEWVSEFKTFPNAYAVSEWLSYDGEYRDILETVQYDQFERVGMDVTDTDKENTSFPYVCFVEYMPCVNDDLPSNYERDTYRYFLPEQDEPKYAAQDYKRMYELERGDWSFVWLKVTLIDADNNYVVGDTVLSGVESDYIDDFVQQLGEEVYHEQQYQTVLDTTMIELVNESEE